MTHLLDATIFPTLHDDTIVEWNIDGLVDLGDSTEQAFSWSTEAKPQLRQLLNELSAEVSRLAMAEGRGESDGFGVDEPQT